MKIQGSKLHQIVHNTTDTTDTRVEEMPEKEFRKLINEVKDVVNELRLYRKLKESKKKT